MVRSRRVVWCGLAGLVLFLSGCLVNQYTRMPQPRPRHPRTEQRSFEFHDPFASKELGPVGGPRPPGMGQPRTEARRAMEQRAAHGGVRPRSWSVPTLPFLPRFPAPQPQPILPQVVPE